MLLETAAATTEVVTQTTNNRLGQIIADSDPIIKFTLLLLVFFSVASWAIIFLKTTQLRAAKVKVKNFIEKFSRSQSIDAFLKQGGKYKGPALNILSSSLVPLRNDDKPGRQLRAHRETERAAREEIEALEEYVPFLATTASATPFIGLFGTCWGILNAFFELSAAGSSGIQVVGPRISEALFATAVGLAAAIPAVIFYNYFSNQIRQLTRSLEQFALDLNERIDNEYFAA